MSKLNSIKDCNRGKDARKLAQQLAREHPDRIEYGNGGNHPYVKVKGKGKMPIPRKEWGKGLKRAVQKQWWALGLPALAFLIFQITR